MVSSLKLKSLWFLKTFSHGPTVSTFDVNNSYNHKSLVMSKTTKKYEKCLMNSYFIILFNFILMMAACSWMNTWKDQPQQDTLSVINVLYSNSTNHTNVDTNESFTTMNQACLNYIYLDFYETKVNTSVPDICTIRFNASYSIHFRITHTIRNVLHLIESLNEWDNGTMYAIKTYPFYKKTHHKEYDIMVHLTQFCSKMECHTIRVFPQYYPFTHIINGTKSYAIMFMQYLSDTLTYKQFETEWLWKNRNAPQTFQFIDDCFANISTVLNQLWMKDLLHNDWHKENILVSQRERNECYLIDFNQMFALTNLTHSDIKEYRGIISLQTPMSWHYLSTNTDRNKYIQRYGNDGFYTLKRFAHAIQQYKVNTFILEALLTSKAIQRLHVEGMDSNDAHRYFKYVSETIHSYDNRRYHINSSDAVMYRNMRNVWCCRLEQMVYILKVLKAYDDVHDNIHSHNILQNMFDLYHELKKELALFDVRSDQCILVRKYHQNNMEVQIPHFMHYPLSV
eukprot:178478_1